MTRDKVITAVEIVFAVFFLAPVYYTLAWLARSALNVIAP